MPYQVKLLPAAIDDCKEWKATKPAYAAKIEYLIESIKKDPRKGIGKPKPLRHWPGAWSRRVSEEHRIVYEIRDELVLVYRCFGHYE